MRFHWLERVNPFVKAVTILLCGIMLAFTKSWQLAVVTTIVCLLSLILGTHCRLPAIAKIFGPVILIAAAIFYSGLVFGKPDAGAEPIYSASTMGAALLMSSRLLAYVSMGLAFALSSDREEFVVSLIHQAHLKPKFAYGVLAALHLLPTLQREWQEVCLAYQVRGRKKGIFGPLFNTLVNSIRWSENVAMAMESKGFDGDGKRTYAIVTRVRTGDIIFVISSFALLTAGIILI